MRTGGRVARRGGPGGRPSAPWPGASGAGGGAPRGGGGGGARGAVGEGVRGREGVREEVEARVEGLLRAALRFARPDGSAAFGPAGAAGGRAALIRFWAGRLADPGPATVARWWWPE